MAKRKALSAVIILSAAFAATVFAREAVGSGYGAEPQLVANYRSHHHGAYDQNFRGAYDQSGASFYARPPTNEERRNLEDLGFSGRDPSRVGGEDPYLHPGG